MAAFPQTLYKAAGAAVKNTSAKAASQAISQAAQTFSEAKRQIGLPPAETGSKGPEGQSGESAPIEAALVAPAINREEIALRERKALAELEAKLAQIRANRERAQLEWRKTQDQIMSSDQSVEPQPTLGFVGKTKRAIGSVGKRVTSALSTIQNRKQGETKAGSTKG